MSSEVATPDLTPPADPAMHKAVLEQLGREIGRFDFEAAGKTLRNWREALKGSADA